MKTTFRTSRKIFIYPFFLSILFVAGCGVSQQFLQKGDRIIFFGDSITQLGVKPKGYVSIVYDSLHATRSDLNVEVIGAGISGNKVTDLKKRLQRDVLDKKPAIVVIYIGINDVWHYALPNLKGTPKDEFESGLKEIIAAIQSGGARVILCTPSVIGEKNDGTNPQDGMLNEYSAISRRVVQETGSRLCDLRKLCTDHLKAHNPRNEEKGILTYDRVHLNDEGNKFVAEALLRVIEN